MKFDLFELTVLQFIRSLSALSDLLDKAATFASSRKISDEVMLQTRLAPDQFPLSKQVQIACDNAKLSVSRLTDIQAPVFEDTEKTFSELKVRIQKTIDFLKSVPASAYTEASEQKDISFWWNPGHTLSARNYVIEYLLPNFYFHFTTAYSILRSCGIELGKNDYLRLSWK